MNSDQREKAVELRKAGKTYSEILKVVPVAKSTLSLWLREVGLSTQQTQKITERRIAGARKGARARTLKRKREIAQLTMKGVEDIGTLSKRELWLIGIALYWAEGSKQRDSSVSERIAFANSDPRMLKLFIVWLGSLGIASTALIYEIYLHETRASEVNKVKRWWSKELGISVEGLQKVYFKRGNPKTNRRSNTGDLYHGLLRIKVRSSTSFNRQVNGWVQGIVNGACS